MRQSITLLLVIFVLILRLDGITMAKSVDTQFDGELNYWFSEFDGNVQIAEGALAGTKIDLVSDLGMDDSEPVPNATISYRFFENSKVSLSYFNVETEGNKNITRQFNYKGNIYTVGTTVASELDLTVIEGKYGYRFLSAEEYELYGLVGVKYAKIEAELVSTTFGARREEIEAPVPVIGLAAEFRPYGKFAIGGEVNGLTISTGDVDFTLIDILANVSYDITQNLRASAGYRYFNIDGSNDDDSTEVTYKGPYIAIVGSF